MKVLKGYVGTYDAKGSKGIYQFEFDTSTNTLISSKVAYEIHDAKYLSLQDDVLAFVYKDQHAGVGYIYEKQMYTYDFGESVACYVTQDDTHIYTANYHDGTLGVFEKRTDGIHPKKIIKIQEKGGCHQVLKVDQHLLVPCLLLDTIEVYDKQSLQHVKTCVFPKGSGPRHGVMHPDKKRIFVLSELSCELFLLNEQYDIVKSWSLLKKTQQGAGAAIVMSQDGRFLYMSIRGVNKLYVLDIEKEDVIQVMDCNGDHPRDIALDPSHQYLFVANRFTNELVVYKRDAQYGTLQALDTSISIIEAVSIVFVS